MEMRKLEPADESQTCTAAAAKQGSQLGWRLSRGAPVKSNISDQEPTGRQVGSRRGIKTARRGSLRRRRSRVRYESLRTSRW